MPPNLRDVTREFARGQAPLETLRRAAREEPIDRQLADGILKLIADWERTRSPASAWSRNDLRARAKELVPPDPPASSSRRNPTESMYEAGLRGQRRQS
jgi:hypothetical protein